MTHRTRPGGRLASWPLCMASATVALLATAAPALVEARSRGGWGRSAGAMVVGHRAHHPRFGSSGAFGGFGRRARSEAARQAFKARSPCPSTMATRGACPGYVIDHIRPLKRGGPDSPYNMQWQTVDEARAKDRVE